MQITAESIAYGLDKGRRVKRDSYTACCPSHSDRSPSLSITQTSDRVLLYCHSGCSQAEVISALLDRGLWQEKSKRLKQQGPLPLTQGQKDYLVSFALIYRGDANRYVVHREADTVKYHRAVSRLRKEGIAI